MNNTLTSAFAKTLVALFLLGSTPLLANPTNPTAPAKPASFDASVYITKANKIRLAVEKNTVEPVHITLRQAGGSEALFSRQLGRKQTKVAIQLDVDQLADGAYELEIKSATGIIVKRVNLGQTTPVAAPERVLAIK